MIDLFGIRRRREERERLEEERIRELKANRKRKIENRKAIIDPFLEQKSKEAEEAGKKEQEKELKECEAKNSVCPKCGGKNVINRFVRVQGKIDGHSHGYFGGSYGNVSGELDTLKVNECKDCGNQWEIAKPDSSRLSDYIHDDFSIYNYGSFIGFLYRRIDGILEKKDGEINRLEPMNLLIERYKSAPREALEYCLYSWYKIHEDDHYIHPNEKILGTKLVKDEKSPDFNADPYLFKLNEETWGIIEILTGKREP